MNLHPQEQVGLKYCMGDALIESQFSSMTCSSICQGL